MGPVGYMVSTKLLVGILGIVLAFAPTAIYPFYAHHPHYWGLSPREDQNMAGLVMALEQSIVMGIALVVLFVQMLTESEREAQRAERFEVAEASRTAPITGAPRRRRGEPRRRAGTISAQHLVLPLTVSVCGPPGVVAVNCTLYGRLPALQPIDR